MSWPAPTIDQRTPRPEGQVYRWREAQYVDRTHPTNPNMDYWEKVVDEGWVLRSYPYLFPEERLNYWEFCHANRDGDCVHSECPQLRDGEPMATGRWCPLRKWEDLEE